MNQFWTQAVIDFFSLILQRIHGRDCGRRYWFIERITVIYWCTYYEIEDDRLPNKVQLCNYCSIHREISSPIARLSNIGWSLLIKRLGPHCWYIGCPYYGQRLSFSCNWASDKGLCLDCDVWVFHCPRPLFISGQVWGHTPQQCVGASTQRRYSFGLHLAIAQAGAMPAMPMSFR